MKVILKKWGLLSVLLVLTLTIITGCGTQEKNDVSNIEKEDAQEEVVKNNESQFPVTITDGANREVTIDDEPKTIVSIQTSSTEISFALGLVDKIIGVSDYDNYPPEALEKEKVGAQDINTELVLSLLPDLALVTDYHYNTHPELLKQFEEAGIDVVVVGDASSFEDVYGNIELIAEATGSNEQAQKIITDMKQRHEAIKEKAKMITDEKKVWVEVSPAPDIFTTGTNTFMHEMLESINATNAAEAHEGWVKLTEEEIVQLNPDVIITTYGYYIDNPRDQVLSREGWNEVPAVKNEQVFDVDSDTVTRPGPRLIEGVEAIAEFVYPEVFN